MCKIQLAVMQVSGLFALLRPQKKEGEPQL